MTEDNKQIVATAFYESNLTRWHISIEELENKSRSPENSLNFTCSETCYKEDVANITKKKIGTSLVRQNSCNIIWFHDGFWGYTAAIQISADKTLISYVT